MNFKQHTLSLQFNSSNCGVDRDVVFGNKMTPGQDLPVRHIMPDENL